MRLLAPRFFGHQSHFDSLSEFSALHSGFDIFWRCLEDFALGNRAAAFVIRNQRRNVGCRRDGNALGFFRWDKYSDRAVISLQIPRSRSFHTFRRDLLDVIAMQAVKSPIPLRDPLA